MNQLRFALIILCLLHLTNAAEAGRLDPELVVATPHAKYELRKLLPDETFTCLYKNNVQLTCIDNEFVRFGEKISTRDYILLPIYDSCDGAPRCGRSGTTLIIERGNETLVSFDFKEYCLECSKSVEANYDQNEVKSMLDRVDGKIKVAARFKDGSMIVGKSALKENEPLKRDECDWLYGEFLDGCNGESAVVISGSRRCAGVKDRLAMAYVRSLEAIAREYAGFPTNDLDRICDAVCSSRKKPGRAQFDRRICRR